MSVDFIVASLPALAFGLPAPIDWVRFQSVCGGEVKLPAAWADLETQLRNAMAEARLAAHTDATKLARYRREAAGCSLYWRNRVLACFQVQDVLERDEQLDRVWWDAAGELTPPTDPLGKGALATYAIRLKLALKRDAISAAAGSAAFDRLTADTKVEF